MKVFDFSENDKLKLDNEIEKKRNKYFSRKNSLSCLCSSCNYSAVNSHAISEKLSLEPISKGNHLKYFSSRRSKDTKNFYCEDISIDSATTFKGFCCEHEKLFEKLDNNKDRNSIYELLLQSYRSICFSLYNVQVVEKFQKIEDSFVKNHITCEILRSHLGEEAYCLTDSQLMQVFEDFCQMHTDKFLEESRILEKYKKYIENTIFSADELFKKHTSSINNFIFCEESCELGIFYKKLDFCVPVALLNHHMLSICNEKNILLFNVIPYEDCSEIYWIFDKKFINVLKEKWDNMISKDINILNMIERSMVSQEYWYISPNIINGLAGPRLDILKNDVFFNNEHTLFDEYDFSIFDDLRKNMIEYMPDIIKNIESKKMGDTIIRTSFDERFKNYQQEIQTLMQIPIYRILS